MIQYITLSVGESNFYHRIASYQTAGWTIVKQEDIGGSRYKIVLMREAPHFEKLGFIGIILFIITVAELMVMAW